MLGQYGLNDLGFVNPFAGPGGLLALGLEVVHMKTQYVAIFDSMGDGVPMQAALKQIIGRAVTGLLTFDLLIVGVLFKNRCAYKAKELGLQHS